MALMFKKSFASFVSRILVGLFSTSPGAYKPANYATDKRLERLRERLKPCKRETSARRLTYT